MDNKLRPLDSIRSSPLFQMFLDALEQRLPPLRALHRRVYQRHFAKPREFANMFNGVYDDFPSAMKAIPPHARVGCDNVEGVDRFNLILDKLWPSDYPILFWLSTLIEKGTTVFDLGGNVGLAFWGCAPYIDYPPDLAWTVCEVPVVAQRGKELAEERKERRLFFTTDMEQAGGVDILLASGALHMIEAPLWDTLAKFPDKPRHLLINRVPLYDGPSFATMYDIGPAITAYQIWNRLEFIKHFEDCGYELIDFWATPEWGCSIPFYRERKVDSFVGMYLKRGRTKAA
jgi:putative methyltransferase (TIGR04325 family)